MMNIQWKEYANDGYKNVNGKTSSNNKCSNSYLKVVNPYNIAQKNKKIKWNKLWKGYNIRHRLWDKNLGDVHVCTLRSVFVCTIPAVASPVDGLLSQNACWSHGIGWLQCDLTNVAMLFTMLLVIFNIRFFILSLLLLSYIAIIITTNITPTTIIIFIVIWIAMIILLLINIDIIYHNYFHAPFMSFKGLIG